MDYIPAKSSSRYRSGWDEGPLPSPGSFSESNAPVSCGLQAHGQLVPWAGWLLLSSACLGLAYYVRVVCVPVALAWVIAMALEPPMRWLRRWRLPGPLAALIVVTLFSAALLTAVVQLGRPAVAWAQDAPKEWPRLKEKYGRLLRPVTWLMDQTSRVGNLGAGADGEDKPQDVRVKDNRVFSTVFTWTGGIIVEIAETVVLVFMFLAVGNPFMRVLTKGLADGNDRHRAEEMAREIQHNTSRYLFSVGLINLALGGAVGLTLLLLGMPGAAMWGGIVALLNFIPYFGPFVGMAAVAVAGLLAFDTIGQGFLPALGYLGLHLLEADLVTPYVLGRRFALSPVIIFVSLMLFSWLWGVVGGLLAAPLLVSFKVVCDHSSNLSACGDFLSHHTSAPGSNTSMGRHSS